MNSSWIVFDAVNFNLECNGAMRSQKLEINIAIKNSSKSHNSPSLQGSDTTLQKPSVLVISFDMKNVFE